MRLLLFLSIFWMAMLADAQQTLTISAIQGSGNASAYAGQSVMTTGVVTARYVGSGTINGFFLQSKVGDGDPNTSDGIFVYSPNNAAVEVGDEISLTATVSEYNGRTQLTPADWTVLSKNNTVQPERISYSAANWSWEKYEGMLVEMEQTLWVNDNRRLDGYGELSLGTRRKTIPTNIALPLSGEYAALVNENKLPPIYLDDARTETGINPPLFADENGTRRLGEKIDGLCAVVDQINASKYLLYPAKEVVFYGNPRKDTPDDIGEYNLKVCGFNLQYYLTAPSSYGARNATEMERQHAKIVDALAAIDADIYGLVEIEQGQQALSKLAQALNDRAGTTRYTYINDGGNISGTYTKSAYLYRSDRVTAFKTLTNINSPTPLHRKKLQGFTLNANNERLILSVNHFKAKSGCPSSGADADKDDGQSCFNATRVAEANAVISAINARKATYETENVLVIGDLNAYGMEDPVRQFVQAGYVDLHRKFHADSAYSYVYETEAGYIDHALANDAMATQVTGVTAFHINADELPIYGYRGTKYDVGMYRSSDHDPVIVGINLRAATGVSSEFEARVKIYPAAVRDYFWVKNATGAHVQLFSLNGVERFRAVIPAADYTVNVAELELPAGVYIVRVQGDGGTIVRKVVVQE